MVCKSHSKIAQIVAARRVHAPKMQPCALLLRDARQTGRGHFSLPDSFGTFITPIASQSSLSATDVSPFSRHHPISLANCFAFLTGRHCRQTFRYSNLYRTFHPEGRPKRLPKQEASSKIIISKQNRDNLQHESSVKPPAAQSPQLLPLKKGQRPQNLIMDGN